MKQTMFPNTPAITREAEDPEMEQWAFEATAAIEAARVGGVTYLARMKDAGEYLTKARKKCQHGKWIPWLERHNIPRTSAFRAIQAYSKCSTLEHLDDAIEVMAEKGEEKETCDPSAKPPSNKQFCSRNCRIGIGPSNCKACVKLNKAPSPPPPVSPGASTGPTTPENTTTPPEVRPVEPVPSLEEFMGQAPTYEKLAKSLRIVSKKLRKLERSEIHRRLTGRKTEQLADSALGISQTLEKVAPKAPCAACGGVVNLDAEPCKGCNGKGVLTAAEVLAEKERLDF